MLDDESESGSSITKGRAKTIEVTDTKDSTESVSLPSADIAGSSHSSSDDSSNEKSEKPSQWYELSYSSSSITDTSEAGSDPSAPVICIEGHATRVVSSTADNKGCRDTPEGNMK